MRGMKETIAIAGGHPDDLVGSLGFALLAKDRFDIHMLDFTRGEVGWSGHDKEETARVRTAEEQPTSSARSTETPSPRARPSPAPPPSSAS